MCHIFGRIWFRALCVLKKRVGMLQTEKFLISRVLFESKWQHLPRFSMFYAVKKVGIEKMDL